MPDAADIFLEIRIFLYSLNEVSLRKLPNDLFHYITLRSFRGHAAILDSGRYADGLDLLTNQNSFNVKFRPCKINALSEIP